MNRYESQMSPRILTCRVAALGIVLLALAGHAPEISAQPRQIDLGSPETIEVTAPGDPLSLVRIPPGAFGKFPPGTWATIGMDIPSCNGPNCLSGRAYLVWFDDGGCCGGGALVGPVTVQIRYDEEEVRRFGVDETDVVLAEYDPDHRQWVPVSEQTIDVEQNIVFAPEADNIRIFVAAFASAPQPVAPATWGGIKAVFGNGVAR